MVQDTMTMVRSYPEQHSNVEQQACADLHLFYQGEYQREDDMPTDPLEKARV